MVDFDARPGLLFLAAPVFVFLLGFVRLEFAAPLAALLAWTLWRAMVRTPVFSPRAYLAPAIGAVAVSIVAGFPNGPFAWDWIKHWALIGLLADSQWPPVVVLRGDTAHLRFYAGAYLVPALLHKSIPTVPAWIATWAWFTLGFALVLRAATAGVRAGAASWLAMAMLLAVTGLDAFAEHWYRHALGLSPAPWVGVHYEEWMFNATRIPLQYSGMIAALTWVPHQSVATFLVASMLVRPPAEGGLPEELAAFGLLALWSPFGMIGLAPMVLARALGQWRRLLSPDVLRAQIAGAGIALLVLLYLATDMPASGACVACLPARLGHWREFLPFLAVELGVFALILQHRLVRQPACLVALCTLLAIPLMYTTQPDFVMRASLGPVFVLALRSVQTILEWRGARMRRAVQVAALCLCLPTAASEIVYHLQGARAHRQFAPIDPLGADWMRTVARDRSYTVEEFLDLCGWKLRHQYFSRWPPLPLRTPVED